MFENLHSFKVAEASDLISWLDFLLDNLFLCFGQGVYRQCIGAWKGEPRCASFLGGQIKILAASFVERGVQTFILLELHWF